MKIVIVGSGNAGLISALMLANKFPHFFIEIISSEDIELGINLLFLFT